MNHLQKALTLNTIFSLISGITLVLFHNEIANIFGTTNYTAFWIIGLALIYFALTIWYERIKQRKLAVIWIIIQDFLWVIGSVVLLVFNPLQITPNGNILIGVIAGVVLVMGINQIIAFKKVSK